MKQPLVSVIMPTYNNAEYLVASIFSVLKQTYKNLELIVIDDFSSDSTPKLMTVFQMEHQIKYIRLERNLGVSKARNIGITKAIGEYIAFIDSDDIWKPDKLMCQIAFMKQKKIDFTYTYYELIDEQDHLLKKIKKIPSEANYTKLLKTNFIPILTVVLRKEILFGKQFESVAHEDYLLWLKILKSTDFEVELFPRITAGYRVHAHSISSNKIKSACWVWKIYRKHERIGIVKSIFYFLNYLIYGVIKHFHVD